MSLYKLASLPALLLTFHSCYSQQGPAGEQQLPAGDQLSGAQLAKRHSIVYDKPAPRFFEGALLGNGGMGVVATTRPDAIVFYFGHNNVWDIRIAENNRKEIRDFKYVFDKVRQIPETLANLTDDPWYAQYVRMTADNYQKPYPRPFPCGSVLLGFDRRKLQVLGHTLDISNGLCTIRLLTSGKKALFLKVFTDMNEDRLYMQLTDGEGHPQANVFDRIKVMPDPSTPNELPRYEATEALAAGMLSFRQILPARSLEKSDPSQKNDPSKEYSPSAADRAFRLTVKVNTALTKTTRINWNGNSETMAGLEAALVRGQEFTAVVSLQEGLNSSVDRSIPVLPAPTSGSFDQVLAGNEAVWGQYWSQSAVRLGDEFLERIWYRNLYFLNCAIKAGITCPGLFANWSYNRIGTAWHGDYHLNYNVQQPFWATFSSNHLEKNLPYVSLIETLMPVSRKWAHDYYGLPGAYFPHSAYPVEMTMNPYPVPDWGWEISETPWAVQGLWWHYLYSSDTVFLRDRAYGPIKSAVQFLAAYMKRPDGHGGKRWQDDKYHIFPTIPPELYGLRPGFKNNYDCAVDLALTKFVFKAFKRAAVILGKGPEEKDLLADVEDILSHYPEYPRASSATAGTVLVSVPGESDQTVYNVPDALISVFPGEDYGLHSDKKIYRQLADTYKNQQNEGGNDLVFLNLQAARIGMLDLEDFKRQINYCLLPNGTATDMAMQVHGRYNDFSDYGYMADMGIWLENFALPAVIDECLMQSYDGTIRLFPNWPKAQDASFTNLRAAGAFLVSATQKNDLVTGIRIQSEKGGDLRLIVPWGSKGWMVRGSVKDRIATDTLTIKTLPGEIVTLQP
jgi:alpha-L-fucosidase 2